MQRDSLWVPERISTALVKVGLGKESIPLLVRETPVPKAAWSKPSERPKGAASKLAEAFPLAQIQAFAATRTISDPSDFQAWFNPVIGTVQYSPNTEGTVRRP